VARPANPVPGSKRRRLTVEVLIVLAIFPFPYVVNALVVLIQAAVHQGATGRFPIPISSHFGLSFLIDVLLTLEPLAAAGLVLYLLSISGEGGARSIGLDNSDPRQDLALLLPVFVCCFLVPEFGVSLLLRAADVRAIAPATQHLPGYFAIVGATNAISAGVVEEIVVLGFLVRRLEQHGLGSVAVVTIAVLVRISYHIYYGWGVLPIAAWALASVLMYRRFRRLAPFIAVHGLWDLALILIPFFGGGPLAAEVLLLGPSTFVFWLMWRNRLAKLPPAARSGPGWRAR
jgi:membrane protease YdiL (CAAX protease family)